MPIRATSLALLVTLLPAAAYARNVPAPVHRDPGVRGILQWLGLAPKVVVREGHLKSGAPVTFTSRYTFRGDAPTLVHSDAVITHKDRVEEISRHHVPPGQRMTSSEFASTLASLKGPVQGQGGLPSIFTVLGAALGIRNRADTLFVTYKYPGKERSQVYARMLLSDGSLTNDERPGSQALVVTGALREFFPN